MSNWSNKGKFSDRLRKMRRDRLRKRTVVEEYDNEKVYINFLKVVAAIPVMVHDNVFDKKTSNVDEKNKSLVELSICNDKFKKEKLKITDVSLIKKKQYNFFKNSNFIDKKILKETNKDSEVYVKELEKKIINLIKKDLIKMVNELEILESELYILSEVTGDEKTLTECKRNIDEVKKILCKIDNLKRKYDFLKDNYDFEYLLEFDNNELIDNIIELRDIFDNNQVKALSEDYKLLDVYKFLYLRIDQMHEDTFKFEKIKLEKEKELKERDIDFEKLKEDVYNIKKTNDSYDNFIKEQNIFLNDLEKNISKIDSHEVFDYKLKGFNSYLFNSFKYLGLLMMSPLRGVIPGIAMQTLITREVVNNLYRNLQWEENKRVVYESFDYSFVISKAIDDLDFTDRVVTTTLDDLVKLKMEYNNKFRKYQCNFLEYEEIIKKINDMENKILGNKIKIEIMRNKMKIKQRENEEKFVLVKKLNDEQQKNSGV